MKNHACCLDRISLQLIASAHREVNRAEFAGGLLWINEWMAAVGEVIEGLEGQLFSGNR
jgi:hypothetical protein